MGPALTAQVNHQRISIGQEMGETATLSILLKSLSYGIPAGMIVLIAIITPVWLRYQKMRTDKDRKEHMEKWQSMIDIQDKAIIAQKEATIAIVQSHKAEIDRMFTLQNRQAETLEALAHNLSTITSKIEQKTVCPKEYPHA